MDWKPESRKCWKSFRIDGTSGRHVVWTVNSVLTDCLDVPVASYIAINMSLSMAFVTVELQEFRRKESQSINLHRGSPSPFKPPAPPTMPDPGWSLSFF